MVASWAGHVTSVLCLQTIQGFVFSPFKCSITVLLIILTGGLFLILLTWRADIKLNCVYKQVGLLEAQKILLKVKQPLLNNFLPVWEI